MTDLPSAFTHEQCCTLVAEAVATFAEVAREVDPATPIPTCPGWTLSKLIRHTGTIHRWVAEIVATGSQERVDSRSLSLALPDDDRWLPGWLAGGGDALVEVLAAADPEAPVWAWGADQHVRFWPRRMIHETTVHRVDAERQPLQSAVDPLVAADGIDEFFTNVKPSGSFSPEVAELRGDGSLAFVAIDRALGAGARWRIDLADDGFTVARTDESGAEAADATVTGPPDRVLLLLYGRLELSTPGLSLTGDHALVDWWIEKSSLT